MKNKIVFVLLLAAVSLLGIKGADITERLLRDKNIGNTVIPRSSVESGAVYIDADSEISFDPMRIVKKGTSVSWNESEERHYFYGNFQEHLEAADFIELLLRAFAGYSQKTAFDMEYGFHIGEYLRVSSDGYYYADDYPYMNTLGEQRYVDMIITSDTFDIVYIDFFGTENSVLTEDEKKNAVNRFIGMSNEMSDTITKYLYNDPSVFEIGGSYESDLPEYLKELCYPTYREYDRFNAVSPIIDFITHSYGMSWMILERYYGYDWNEGAMPAYGQVCVSLISKYVWGIMQCIEEGKNVLSDADYVCIGDKVYQTVKFPDKCDARSAVVIYNAAEDIVEGIFINTNKSSIW